LELSLKDYFFIIIKKWKIILAFVLAGILIMFFWSYFLIDDRYEIKTTSDLNPKIEGSEAGASLTNKEEQAFNRLVSKFKTHITEADYIFERIWDQDLDELFSSYDDTVLSQKGADISFETEYNTVGQWAEKLGYTKKSLKRNVDFAFSEEDAGFLTISIVAKNPEFGVVLLASYNYVSTIVISEMSEPASVDVTIKADYIVLDHPAIPEDKDVIRPNIPLNMFLGALVSLILAVSVILIINYYDVKIKGEDDIREKFDVPVIATIPDVSEIKKGNIKNA
jgi:capsular polysaccharide biosynthesis protein